MNNTQVPKTREEDYASSIFEWVKADREGDICRFKEFTVVNGEEYIVFNDNTRINSNLLGDVVLKHQHESQILGKEINIAEKITNVDEPYEFPLDSDLVKSAKSSPSKKPHYVADAQVIAQPSIALVSQTGDSPVLTILNKSKKKKQKVNFEIQLEIPSSEVLSIIRENFEGSDEELYKFFVEKLDKKKFVSAIISAVQNK